MKPKTEIWHMTADQACLAWEIFQEVGAHTEEQRAQVLHALKELGHIKGYSVTGRNKDQVLKDLSKEFKILKVENKDDKV